MIELKHVKKEFENVTPLKDVNAVINDGDVISIIGPSGTGKSTLLRCINMLDAPTSGQVIVNGEDITRKGCDLNRVRQKMGMVFQSFNLFNHLTIIENIMTPQIDLLHKSRQEAYDKGISLLRQVGLVEKALNYPDDLSGGQKQRVAIARTLAMDPDIILFDEPTSALDPTMIGEVQAVIRQLAESGRTMMIVTHEMKFAREICNRVFYMDEGGIYEDGTPEQIFENPQKENTRRFIRHLKVHEIEINSIDFDFLAAINGIELYAYKNQIPYPVAKAMTVIYEELCQTILLPTLKGDVHIHITFEHEPDSGTGKANIRYNGPKFAPQDSDDILALKLFENSVSSYQHTEINENGFTNMIDATIR